MNPHACHSSNACLHDISSSDVLVDAPLWGELKCFAEDNGFSDVLDSYPATYILETFSCFSNDYGRSEVFGFLRKGVLARQEMHDIEREMDKAYFEELVTGGTFMISGTSPSAGWPVMWVDFGSMCHKCWSLIPGSGKYFAYIRAILWIVDLAVFAASSYGATGMYTVTSHLNSSLLEFNIPAFTTIVRLIRTQFPIFEFPKHAVNLKHTGVHRMIPVLLKVMTSGTNLSDVAPVELVDIEDLASMVRDPADIPEFIDEDCGRPHTMADWNARLHYSRCMSDDNKVCLWELLNFSSAAASLELKGATTETQRQATVRSVERLPTLTEGDSDEEW